VTAFTPLRDERASLSPDRRVVFQRVGALLLDYLLLFLLQIWLSSLLGPIHLFVTPQGGPPYLAFTRSLIDFWPWGIGGIVLYFTLFEALFGATPGKIFARLRVIDGHGRRASLRAVVLRNVLRLLDAAPNAYLVGGVVALLSPRQQRLGDHVAGTLVVRASSVAGTSRLPPLSRRQVLVVAAVVPLFVYAVLMGLSYFNPFLITIDRVPHPATNVQSIFTLNLPSTVERVGSWAAGAPYRNGEWLAYHVR
jgi:uncharacterized RDD family membrane protein YckC